MRSTLLTGLFTGLLTATIGVALAAPAGAATLDLHDAGGDVMQAVFAASDPGTEPPSTPAPDQANGDILFTRITHSATQVVVYTRYRDLAVPTQYAGFDFIVEGNNHVERDVRMQTRHGDPQGKVEMVSTSTGNTVTCTIAHHVDYAANTMSLRFNRSCLKTPKYVRVRGVSFTSRFSSSTGNGVITYDDPTRTGGTITEAQSRPTAWIVTG